MTSSSAELCGQPDRLQHLDSVQGLAWRRGAKIGSGGHACVYKALDRRTGLIFAVKDTIIAGQSEDDRKYRNKLEDELRICKELRHPHIVGYLGHAYEDCQLHIYLEYVAGGSVLSLLNEFGPFDGPVLQTASRGMLEGLNYLHTRSPPVVHRDIKGANVLVDLHFCVKLADFGCSKRALDTQSFSTIGSIPWMAPEVIQQTLGHGRKADIWSLGCTFIEMASAEPPWGRDKFTNFMFALRHIALSDATPPVPDSLQGAGREMVDFCMQRSAEGRPQAETLLRHAFVRDAAVTHRR